MSEFDSALYFDNLRSQVAKDAGADPYATVFGRAPGFSVKEQDIINANKRKVQGLREAVELKHQELGTITSSLGSGTAAVVESVGTLYGLATGDMENIARLKGAEMSEEFEQRKPLHLRQLQDERSQAVSEADGQLAEFGTAIWQTAQDPTLMMSLLAEQAPLLVPGGVVGRVAGLGAKAAGKAVGTQATAALSGAVGTGAALQSADVAGAVFNDLVALPETVWAQNPEYVELAEQIGPEAAKEQIALSQARKSAGASAVTSIGTQLLPGGAITERATSGARKASRAAAKAAGEIDPRDQFLIAGLKGFAGEAVQEGIEEGGGQVIGNISKQTINPDQELLEGVGEAAGLGALGGATIGGVAGATGGSILGAGGQQKVADNQGQSKAHATALETGDITPLTDRKQRTYNPGLAADVLQKKIDNEESTEEDKAQAKQQLDELVTSTEADVEAAAKAEALLTEEGIAKGEAAVERLKTELASTTDAEKKAELKDDIEFLEQDIAERKQDTDKKLAQAKKVTAERQAHLERVRSLNDVDAGKASVQTRETADQAATVLTDENSTPEQQAEAVATIAEQAALDPDSVSDEALKAAVISKAATEDTKKQLRAFDEARNARNELQSIKKVSKEVRNGSAHNKGLDRYASDGAKAARTKNQGAATRNLDGLRRFAASHRSKLAALKQAKAEAKSADKSQYVIPIREVGDDGQVSLRWAASPRLPAGAKPGKDGVLAAHPSQKGQGAAAAIVDAIETEIKAIDATGIQLKTQMDSVFGQGAEAQADATPDANTESRSETEEQAPPIVEDPTPPKEEEQRTEPPPTYEEILELNKQLDRYQYLEDLAKEKLKDARLHPSEKEKEEKLLDGYKAKADELVKKLREIEKKYPDVLAAALAQRNAELEQQETRVAEERRKKQAQDQRPARQLNTEILKKIKSMGVGELKSFISGKKKKIESLKKEVLAAKEDPQSGLAPDYELIAVVESELLAAEEELRKRKNEEPSPREGDDSSIDDELAAALADPEPEAETETAAEEEAAVEEEIEEEEVVLSDSDVMPEVTDETKDVDGNLTDAIYRKINLVAAYFTQRKDREDSKAPVPLAYMKDFLSTWIAPGNKGLIREFLDYGDDFTFTEAQTKLLKVYRNKAVQWNDALGKLIKTTKRKVNVRYRDHALFFLKTTDAYELTEKNRNGDMVKTAYFDGVMPENVLTAITTAAFTYIAENGFDMGYNSREDIANFYGEDPKTFRPTKEQYALFHYIGVPENQVAGQLGRKVVQALGLRPKKNAPANELVQLEASLGGYAMALLLEQGVMERVAIKDSDLFAGMNKAEGTEVHDGFHYFIRPAHAAGTSKNKRPTMHPVVAEISEANVGTEGVLNDLFGSESSNRAPSFREHKFTQLKGRKSTTDVPSRQRGIMEKATKRPFKVRKDKLAVQAAIAPEIMLRISGWTPLDGQAQHIDQQRSTESKNQSIEREYENLRQFIEDARAMDENFDAPHYHLPVVWKHQRVGLAENLVNPQTSKVHRFFTGMTEWDSTFDPKQDLGHIKLFKFAVAQGLGIDTDKMSIDDAVAKLEETVKGSAALAIKALQKVDSLKEGETLSDEEQMHILEAVEAAKHENHSLESLVQYANFLNAVEAGTEFTSNIGFEIDGVANGPALAQVWMGTLDASTGESVGFYGDNSDYENYIDWRERSGEQDLYENFIQEARKYLATLTEGQTVIAAMEYFTGDWLNTDGSASGAGRKIIKTPIQSLVFGSGVKSAVQGISNSVIEKYAEKMTAAANHPELSAEQKLVAVQRVTKQWNALLPPKLRLPIPKTIEQALNQETTPAHRSAVIRKIDEVVTKPMKEVIDYRFGDFISRRNSLNTAGQIAWHMHNIVFNAKKEELIQKKIKDGSIPVGKTGKPLQDLAPSDIEAIREELKELNPAFNTVLSNLSDNEGVSAGVNMERSRNSIAEDNGINSQTLELGTKVPSPGAKGGEAKNLNPRGLERTPTAPTAGTVIGSAHAGDSGIAGLTYDQLSVLNLHDALMGGITQILDIGKGLNENTFRALADYSMPMEIYGMLERVNTNFKELAKSQPTFMAQLETAMAETLTLRNKNNDGPTVTVQSLIIEARNAAAQAEKAKLEFLLGIKTVDQYPVEGGAYTVTEADKTKLQKQLDELNELMAEQGIPGATETETAADTEAVTPAPVPAPTKPVDVPQEVVSQPGYTPWGPLAPSQSEVHDNWLVKLFKTRPDRNAKATTRTLLKHLESEKGGGGIRAILAKQLAKALDASTTIRYITKDTPFEDNPLIEEMRDVDGTIKAHGWYDAHKNEVVIMGSDYANSAVRWEIVLHELLHAATMARINAVALKHETDPAAIETVKGLNTLREEVKKQRTSNPPQGWSADDLRKLDLALENVHEFISYGLSDPKIIGYLNKITVTNPAAKPNSENRFVAAGQAFVELMTKLLWGKRANETHTLALAQLTAHTSAIFQMKFPKDFDISGVTQVTGLAKAATPPRQFSSEQVFDGLANTGSGVPADSLHINNLRTMLKTVTNTVYGPLGALKDIAMRTAATTAQDTFLNAVVAGEHPFASELLGVLRLSDQEAFVAESLEVTVRTVLPESSQMQRAMRDLYNEAAKRLSPRDLYAGDWDTASAADRQEATEAYNRIFTKIGSAEGTSDYLSRFAAAGIAYKPLALALSRLAPQVDNRKYEGSLGKRLKLLLERVMKFFTDRYTRTSDLMQLDTRLMTLAQRMAQIEARRQTTLQERQDRAPNLIERHMDTLTEGAKNKIAEIGNSHRLQSDRNTLTRTAGYAAKITATVAEGRANEIMTNLKKVRDRAFGSRLGFMAEMVNEAWGHDVQFQALLRASKKHEQERALHKEQTAKWVKESFGEGVELTKDQLDNLTRVVVRLDLTSLYPQYNITQLEQLLNDETYRNQQIEELEGSLSGPLYNFYIKRAKELAYHMATGKTVGPHLLLNAHNIAFAGGMEDIYGTISESAGNRAMQTLDPLISLYAMEHLSGDVKNSVTDLMASQRARTDGGHGVETVLNLHRLMQQEALDLTFSGNPVHMKKGYTKEIYNPHIKVVVADTHQGAELVRAGWKEGLPLAEDPHHRTGQTRALYAIRDGGNGSTVTGIISNTGKRVSGKTIHGGVTSVHGSGYSMSNANENARILSAKKRAIALEKNASRGNVNSYNPARVSPKIQNTLAPVLNEAGEVVNYRYLMEHKTKDTLLERDNRIDQVLGAMAASTFDKAGSEHMNKVAIRALKDTYDAEFASNPNAFVEFGPNAEDKDIREAYRLLPEQTKRDLAQTWGRSKMMVRNDLYNITFGYRKISAAAPFDTNPVEMHATQEIIINFLSERFPKLPLRVKAGEDVWQAIVAEVKDIVVIKNVVTLAGNIMSNVTLLWWQGVPIADIIKFHGIALTNMVAFNADRRQLYKLERMIDSNAVVGDVAEVQQKIVELRDAMQKNPVKELIDAGLYQTIAEDIETTEDPYSYKSRLVRTLDEKTGWVPTPVKKGAKFLYMAHDTPLYQVLHQGTHLSDFMARYTLHQHMTTKRDPMSREASLQLASDAFVNYDIPTHKYMQYMNDMGLMFFTKYYVRIQRVLLNLYKDQPARALGLTLLENFIPSLASVTESTAFARVGLENPFDMGALNYPFVVDELATLKIAMSPFD